MRYIQPLLAAALLLMVSSCTQETRKGTEANPSGQPPLAYPAKIENQTMYEVNVRQYTPEGTFKAFEEHIPRLRNMGIGILWFMPINPIGVEKRKGSLGSYYSVKNYTEVNPEFGTLDDFKEVVNKAHELNMEVIIDWVPNHTAWDNPWMTEHPEYYTRDSLGNVLLPDPDWTDVAALNYQNHDLWKSMIDAMKFWITETDIDGFRCDHAHNVPADFWKTAIPELKATKDILMLAEAEGPQWHEAGFDMTYAWEFHHLMNEVAQGKKKAPVITEWLKKDTASYPGGGYRLAFTTNHDENSWNGTVVERLGDAYKTFAALSFSYYGFPLIYSGQEAGLNKRLRFFDKDTIDFHNLALQDFYQTLIQFRKNNPAAWCGERTGIPKEINTDNLENVLAFERTSGTNTVIGLFNLSPSTQSFSLDKSVIGDYVDLFSNNQYYINAQAPITLGPWDYMILSN